MSASAPNTDRYLKITNRRPFKHRHDTWVEPSLVQPSYQLRLPSILLSWLYKPSVQRDRESDKKPLLISDVFSASQWEEEQPQVLGIATQWYLEYLTEKIVGAWPLISRVVCGLEPSHGPRLGDERIISALFSEIIKQFGHEDFAIADIADALDNKKLLKDTENRRHAHQLVFAIYGWLSFLYRPQIQTKEEIFSICTSHGVGSLQRLRRRRKVGWQRLASDTIVSSSQSTDLVDRPLSDLLRSLGIPLENTRRSISTSMRLFSSYPSPPPLPLLRPEESRIDLALVCFHTLNTIASIEIDWVDTIDLHLEFDSYTKVLSVFRFPSYCLVMACSKDFMIHDTKQISPEPSPYDPSYDEQFQFQCDLGREFWNEVLLSYRLIFGQTRPSWKAIKKATLDSTILEHSDPLLEILCGRSWENERARRVYEAIDAEDPSSHYDPGADFPILGKRLLRLQRYVRGHKPNTLWTIWYDRRHPNAWWSFWAVIVIGGLTLVLSIIMVILQVVISTFHVYSPGLASPISIPKQYFKRFTVAFGNKYNFLSDRDINATFIVAIALDLLCLTLVAMILRPEFHRIAAPNQPWFEKVGKKTIKWRCHCGQSLKDEYFELVPGAAKSLKTELQNEVPASSCDHLPEDHDIESQLPVDPMHQRPRRRRCGWLDMVTRFDLSWARWKNTSQLSLETNCPPTLDKASGSLSESTEPLLLLVCIEKLDGSIELVQIDVRAVTSDQVLFSLLRNHRLSIRGKWLPFLKFRCLESIEFVQFELWASNEVDVQPYNDCRALPPESRQDEYTFEATETFPPIGPGKLVHLWNSPEHRDGPGRTCLSRFPKRKRERLYVSYGGVPEIGWGIQLKEGVDWVLIWMLIFIIILVGSLVFAIAFSILDHDIQSAFSIASYVVSFTTLGIGACSICTQKAIDRKRS